MKKPLLIGVVALSLLAIGLAGYFYFKPGSEETKGTPAAKSKGKGGFDPNRATPVVVQEARKGDVNIYLGGLGTILPLRTVIVRSRVDGELVRLHFTEGQLVKEGDLLAEIDPRPF